MYHPETHIVEQCISNSFCYANLFNLDLAATHLTVYIRYGNVLDSFFDLCRYHQQHSARR